MADGEIHFGVTGTTDKQLPGALALQNSLALLLLLFSAFGLVTLAEFGRLRLKLPWWRPALIQGFSGCGIQPESGCREAQFATEDFLQIASVLGRYRSVWLP